MKIEMVTLYASPERTVQPGETALFGNDEAQALIDGGFARPVDADGIRTRPVPQPAKAGGRGGKQPADPPKE
ncbi:hypothetical protein ACFV1N_04960 [Streptosporangium canum]|uniref:hypothetical protein n=1 Tax=Streptosporangium canum TaxID=324952 RepID=UPI0036A25123